MVAIRYDGKLYPVPSGGTVLDALVAGEAKVPHSCRVGICQSCIMQRVDGKPSAQSQKGLGARAVSLGLFLACQERPEQDLEVAPPGQLLGSAPVRLLRRQWLAPDVVGLTLQLDAAFAARAGQFVNLQRADGLTRSYSIANCPEATEEHKHGLLELQVRVHSKGGLSQWLAHNWSIGQEALVRGPAGDCTYRREAPDDTLLLVATGTGLAPVLGVVREALGEGHRGQIVLMLGARTAAGLYEHDLLLGLTRRYSTFRYGAWLREGDASNGVQVGDLEEAVLALPWPFETTRTYLCGAPELVHRLRKRLFIAGADLGRIHADAFEVAPPPQPLA